MKYRLEWKYDGQWAESPLYPCNSFGEIMDNVKHVLKSQDNCPLYVAIHFENGTVVRLPV